MSSESAGRPKTVKGAIVALRSNSKGTVTDPNTATFIFQYNPETLTHTVSSLDSEVSREEASERDANSTVELINLNLELDSADQLEQQDQQRDLVQRSLHPALAVLESIMYSQSKTKNRMAPVVLFLWGPNRTVPVWLNSFKVTEEAFDSDLNPIRVRIDLEMKVRDLSEFAKGSAGYAICANHLDYRRTLARLYSEKEVNRGLVEQVSRSVRRCLAVSKKQNKKGLRKR